jgi:hypothetical protein
MFSVPSFLNRMTFICESMDSRNSPSDCKCPQVFDIILENVPTTAEENHRNSKPCINSPPDSENY